eukprot:2449946-Rhodomonas_salina.1
MLLDLACSHHTLRQRRTCHSDSEREREVRTGAELWEAVGNSARDGLVVPDAMSEAGIIARSASRLIAKLTLEPSNLASGRQKST